MKIPGFVKFIVLTLLAFALGVGVAKMQNWKRLNTLEDEAVVERPHPISSAPETAASLKPPAPQTAEKPDAKVPTPAASGKVVSDAPAMPQPAASAPLPSEAPPISQTVKSPAPPAEPVAGEKFDGAFTLADHKGNAVTEKSWPGKYLLVFFGYTHCPDECPATLQKMSVVMDNYDPKGKKIQPLFITTDPDRDTKDILAIYMGGYNSHILGLTGTKARIESAEKAYKVYAAPGEKGAIDHSAIIYLINSDGQLVEVMDPGLSGDEMIAKIRAKAK